MARYAMHIDLAECYGCRACMVACKVENNTPQAAFWMYVFRFEEGSYPTTHVWSLPRPCMHCNNAPCVKVCPVGAMYKRTDGTVVTDHDRCIGCRYCEVACPYGVITFNWQDPAKSQYFDWAKPEYAAMGAVVNKDTPAYRNPDFASKYAKGGESRPRNIAGSADRKGVVGKCTFCVHRTSKGLQPACAAVCPAFAITFGDLDDPASPIAAKVGDVGAYRLAEEVGTEPSVYYSGHPAPTAKSREIEAVRGRI